MLDNLEQIPLGDNVFNPTINPFKNGIVVNYKKVGTRYLSHLLSMPEREYDNSLQMDLFVRMNPGLQNPAEIAISKIENDLSKYYVYTNFDLLSENQNEYFLKELQKYKVFKNTNTFLQYCDVTNFNDFFYKNPKDLYFLIRNPIERFLAGTVQVLIILLSNIRNDEQTREEVKFYTKLNDSEIKHLVRNLNEDSISNQVKLKVIPQEHIFLLLKYLFEKRWDVLLQDVHTENYLVHYKEWINSIEDKTKIKIIDLKQLSTNKSKKLICKLRGDYSLFEHEEFVNEFKQSNKSIYSYFLEKFVLDNSLFLGKGTFRHYIRSEMQIYNQLINSSYYVDLKD